MDKNQLDLTGFWAEGYLSEDRVNDNVKSALKFATGDIIIIQDADLEYNPKDYPDIIRPFIEANADVVYGSRFIDNKKRRVIRVILKIWSSSILFFSSFHLASVLPDCLGNLFPLLL